MVDADGWGCINNERKLTIYWIVHSSIKRYD